MAALVDLFAYLSVLLRGSVLVLQTLAVGGVAFELLVMGNGGNAPASAAAEASPRRIVLGASLGLVGVWLLWLALDSAVLVGTSDLGLADVLGASYFLTGSVVIVCASALAALSFRAGVRAGWLVLPALGVLLGSTATSHAGARLADRSLLLAATFVHQSAVALWIGGLPCLWSAVRRVPPAAAGLLVRRFSRLALASVAALLVAGLGLSAFYVGSPQGLYGTSYGAMVGAKAGLFALLMVLGAHNFFLVRRLGRDASALRRRIVPLVEAEIGIGFAVILAAASLTSQAPAVDMGVDRTDAATIVERFTPRLPRIFRSDVSHPPPGLIFASTGEKILSYLPGQSYAPPHPEEIAFSEDNHQWSGFVVLLMGFLATLAATGRAPAARHWPLLFLGLFVFLFLRADDNYWPLGPEPFWRGFLVPDVLQHRAFTLLIAAFAVFEWRVQTGRASRPWMPFVFPLVCAGGGALLLTHSHALANVKEEQLMELSHIGIAILGIAAGWSRWLQLRLPAEDARLPARIWPACFLLVGILLLIYRES
jgi:putative copper resistance protein D